MENARLQAELLLAAVLDVKRLDLYLQFERPLHRSEVDRYREYVRQRLQRVPVQYITGVAAFRHLELAVTPAVLIPRPETEVLVDVALEFCPKTAGSSTCVAARARSPCRWPKRRQWPR